MMSKVFKVGLGMGFLLLSLGIVLNIAKGRTPEKGSQLPITRSSPSAQMSIPRIEATPVVARPLKTEVELPGELSAYQDVAIYPRIQGFIDWIGVDRGSKVKRGQLLARLSAPELVAQLKGAEAKTGSTQARLMEARAKLAAEESTYEKLKAASKTPGVVAGNDVVLAQKTVEATRAELRSLQEEEKAARDSAQSANDLVSYLSILAPFDGVITERNSHTGSLVGPSGPSPMLRLQSISRLRLTVAVPEKDLSGILAREKVNFVVPAFPNKVFHGTIGRIAHSLDVKTRTMPVELDVPNESGELAPGMYADVQWPVNRKKPSLFVPASAVVTTSERAFVIRIRDGVTEWVDVKRGEPADDWVEIFGKLHAGDQVAVHGTDELRTGTHVYVYTKVEGKR